MKRFLVFSGSDYYPCGGFDDFTGGYDTLDAAIEALRAARSDWGQVIVDGTIIARSRDSYRAPFTWGLVGAEPERESAKWAQKTTNTDLHTIDLFGTKLYTDREIKKL
jgi:hypothetical protein